MGNTVVKQIKVGQINQIVVSKSWIVATIHYTRSGRNIQSSMHKLSSMFNIMLHLVSAIPTKNCPELMIITLFNFSISLEETG